MIDSHHHLWRYSPQEYDWIPSGSRLAEDQLLPQLREAIAGAGVLGTVAVQARQTVEETEFLLDLAERDPIIRGVVGWVPLAEPRVGDVLDRFISHPVFRGVRHVLQNEADEYFLREDFNLGLARLSEYDLRYDLLIYQRQIPAALGLIDRHPELPIILDHIAKPEVCNGRIESNWRSGMLELARRENVIGVKFSGLVTEFPAGKIDPSTVRAYFEETLEIFGPRRVLFASDWPVCLLRLNCLADWLEAVTTYAGPLSRGDRDSVFGENAVRAYNLRVEPTQLLTSSGT